jgi:outer membrane protein OmpA-like peptidoglycan-associated protein
MRRSIAPVLAVVVLAATPLFAARDNDRDGVSDRKDQCPNSPLSAKVDRAGCPIDLDMDGVPNGIDQCGNTPARWDVDDTGCPRDTDKDGVVDGLDDCEGSLEGASVDSRGCTSDTDADGVLDGLDRCQGTPAGYRVEGHGCPVDSDHDGVNEAMDRCPDSRPSESVDADGCRVKAPQIALASGSPLKLEGLTFEKNQIEVPSEAAPVLLDLAASLRDWPEQHIEIGVYTDKKGSAAANRELSRRRAEFVKNYLVGLGVDPSRMVAKGYGEQGNYNERVVQVKAIQPQQPVQPAQHQ